ncbi:CerR family C-terminal domain-containing protein [Paracoccus sp. p3-h83]|uniref:CerR family C-terminal domain-containing protein n=1 Tax=Paracoccus sp. p3-h83 TaxID=3342805 RepID=UPI0035BB1CE1
MTSASDKRHATGCAGGQHGTGGQGVFAERKPSRASQSGEAHQALVAVRRAGAQSARSGSPGAPDHAASPADAHGTRAALIAAGVDLFGQRGFSAVSVRDLVARAGANIAAVSYHFGGKAGLRQACADHVAGLIAGQIGLDALPKGGVPAHLAQDLLEDLLAGALRAFASDGPAAPAVAFLLREVLPDPVLAGPVQAALVDRLHDRMCALWASATGADEASPATRLRMLGLIGQVAIFRGAAPMVLARMGWTALGEAETEALRRALTTTLRAMIAAERAAQGSVWPR